ncbi:MAG: hypothetical protein GTN64_09105 [Candidatus Latescibacteria bacterium]|nr:hypothetical protein [Candidatus Latescibacterota bacterium]NIO78758.1 hypothetical protein [Candidatus Latescibacterota bacterium]
MFYAAREAIRNAARHARGEKETTPLQLGVAIRWDNGLEIVLEDNGVGMEALALETGNQGLALHNTMMAVVGGWMSVDSQPGAYTRVSLKLPENRRLP